MMMKHTSLGQRLAAFMLALVMVLGMVPVSHIQVTAVSDTFGIAEALTEGLTVTGGDTAEVTAAFAGSLQQQVDGWKIGIMMKAPAGMTDEQLQNATYLSGASEQSFAQSMIAQDDIRFVQVWGDVSPEALRAANLADENIVYTWQFNWDGQNAQKVTLTIDPAQITLLDSESIQVYPGADLGYAAVTGLVEPVAITGSETANTVFNFNKRIVVEWQSADEAAGRYQDGWWVGVQIAAPAGMTDEQLAAAAYKFGDTVAPFSDIADGNVINLWIPLNKLLTDTFVCPVYQFDWNNDGMFEQTVSMEYDNAKLVLMKDGERVYYLMGQIASMDAGNVTISDPGEQDVKVDSHDLVLYYMDAANGREAGWWSCLRITAPKGITIGENSDDVKYQYATEIGAADSWSYPQSMYANQDSAKDSAVHYMYLWTPVDPAQIEAGEDLVAKWRFDWDKNGRYEQMITHTIYAENTNLLYIGTDDFHFSDAAEDKKVSLSMGTYQNPVVNEVQASTVKYSLLDDMNPGAATIDPETGVVTLLERGTVTIVATLVLNNGYEAMSIGFTFEIVKLILEGFELTAPEAITYGQNNNRFTNAAIDPTGNGDIRYEILSQESLEGDILDETDPVAVVLDETTGELEIKRSGKITVQATRAEDDTYLTAIATYELIVNRAEQSGAFAEPVISELTYNPAPYELPAFGGYECGDVITYAIEVEDGSAELTEDNKIQTNKAGSFKLVITISGDNCYEEQILALDMTVVTSPQDLSNFFENMGELENGQHTINITYDPNNLTFSNPVVGGNGTGAVRYEIIDGSDVAQIDEETGVLTINKAGEVTVQATKAGDEQYAEAQLCYILKIAHSSEPTFSLKSETMTIYYGVEGISKDQFYEMVVPSVGIISDISDYTVEIVGENEVGAVLTDGNLSFVADAAKQTGTITLKITKEQDDWYNAYDCFLQLSIVYPAMPEYTITDSEGNPVEPNANGWYTGDICIVPAEGWVISTENGRDAQWQDNLPFTHESNGADDIKPVFAFRNTADGSITEMTEIANYKMDKTVPQTEIVIDGSVTVFEWFGQLIGISDETVKVTFKAEDSISGLDYIDYSIDGGKTVAGRVEFDGETSGSYTIELAAQYRDVVSFVAVDMVGNSAQRINDKTIVVDAVVPELLDVKYESTDVTYEEGNTVYAKDATIIFEIKADNFDLSVAPVVTVNNVPQTLTWVTDGMINSAALPLATNNDYVVALSFQDRLGRQVAYEKNVRLDNVAPVISIAYDPVDNGSNGLNYNQPEMKATITINEHNFDPAKFAATVTAADINGNGLEVAELIQNAVWSSNGDVHTAQLTFANDARYGLVLNCTDKAGNSAEPFTADSFVLDHVAATALEITYSDHILLWSDVLSFISFGTYNAEKELIVTVTAQDTVAGIHHFEYVFTPQGMAFSEDNVQIVNPDANPVKGDASVASASFKIPPEVKGYVSFRIVDNAGNVSEWFGDANAIKIVDITPPEALEVSYSEPHRFWDDVLGVITLGAYNAEKELVVTVTATDDLSGIQYFMYKFTAEGEEFNPDGATVIYPDVLPGEGDISTLSASFNIPPEVRGYVSFRAVDMANNVSQWHHENDEPTKVVDITPPEFDVEYADHNAEDMDGDEVIDTLFFNGDANITLKMTEANFDNMREVQVQVSKDGAAPYSIDGSTIEWKLADEEASLYEAVITLSGEGDYVVTVNYTDLSGNAMETFTTPCIVIDETDPVIDITYELDNSVGKTYGDRTYFSAVQTALISIVEKNFRADEVKLIITAQDVNGDDIYVEQKLLAEVLSAPATDQNAWTAYYAGRMDNVYQLEVVFNTEANYTVDIEYVDLAGNAAADYTPDKFTVDMTAPQNLTISYSLGYNDVENVYYYNDMMVVTLTATDDISPIGRFDSKYLTVSGASSVNESVTDGVLDSTISHQNDSYVFVADFYIPREMILDKGHQFNGTVEFLATDYAMNQSDLKQDTQVIVVDNIAPQIMSVSFDTLVQNVHGVSYYADDIKATIVINEANFYREDVSVSVSTNGGSFRTVYASWYNNSADKHTGTLTLDEEGLYVIRVTYKDRSDNEMKTYTSNKMVVDKTAPKIEVSQVAHNSANNAEVIGLTLKVTDKNILTENIVPVLKAVVRNGSSFETVTIELAALEHLGDGVYAATVENLDADGFYTFECSAVDNAKNASSTIYYGENADQSVEAMNFSVNRNGSSFVVTSSESANGSVITDNLNGKYIKGEVELIIKEINVDKVGEGEKKTIFTLNNGSEAKEIVLTEENYKKNVQIGEGGWYETIYTLDNTYFAEDGVYSINIISYDAANNSNVNTKNPEGTITFTVDRTKPVISANITSQQIINSAEYKIHLQLTETNLNGETVKAVFNGQEVELENLGNNEYSFIASSGLRHELEISATDLAGNEADVYKANPFTVSTNFFVRWYANTFWFWFSIIAAIVVAGVVIFILILAKKKKENG